MGSRANCMNGDLASCILRVSCLDDDAIFRSFVIIPMIVTVPTGIYPALRPLIWIRSNAAAGVDIDCTRLR
jgi:hypothetical protein